MTRHLIFLFFLLMVSALACGCGTEAPERSSSSTPRGIEVSNTSNTDPVTNSSVSAPANIVSPSNEGNQTLKNRKLKDIRAAADPSAPKPDIEALLKNSERPAPEDSLFAAALLDVVVERRTFLKHPVLLKVEKVTAADGKASIKVMTRDGRNIDLAGNAFGPLSTASTLTILRAAGLEGPPPVERKLRPSS